MIYNYINMYIDEIIFVQILMLLYTCKTSYKKKKTNLPYTRNPQHVIIAKMHVIFSKKMHFTENMYFIEANKRSHVFLVCNIQSRQITC